MPRRVPLLIVSVGFVLSACGNPLEAGGPTNDSRREPAVTIEAAGTKDTQGAPSPRSNDVLDSSDLPVSPIDYLLFGGMSSTEMERFVDEKIAACMAMLGRKYVARDFEESEPLTRAALKRFRAEYGYALGKPVLPLFDASSDPNSAIMAAMSDDEKLAYIRDLEGGESGGCRGSAQDDLNRAAPVFLLSDLDRQKLYDSYWSDPMIVKAHDDYGDCMSAEGFSGLNRDARGRSYVAQALHDAESGAGKAGDSNSIPRAGPSTPVGLEMIVAMADIKCEEATLWPAWADYGKRSLPDVETLARAAVAANA